MEAYEQDSDTQRPQYMAYLSVHFDNHTFFRLTVSDKPTLAETLHAIAHLGERTPALFQ
jgi:hypothetical protein